MATTNPERERALTRIAGFDEVLQRPDVTMRHMFGSKGLAVRGKLFAFASTAGDLVVKLPEQRVGELALDPMVMRGRPMREWAVVPYADGEERWRAIADEAFAFVDSITP
jgi:hypothetical protein